MSTPTGPIGRNHLSRALVSGHDTARAPTVATIA